MPNLAGHSGLRAKLRAYAEGSASTAPVFYSIDIWKLKIQCPPKRLTTAYTNGSAGRRSGATMAILGATLLDWTEELSLIVALDSK